VQLYTNPAKLLISCAISPPRHWFRRALGVHGRREANVVGGVGDFFLIGSVVESGVHANVMRAHLIDPTGIALLIDAERLR
jgi:hypothetical protein